MRISFVCSKNSLFLRWNFVAWKANKCLVIQETSWRNNAQHDNRFDLRGEPQNGRPKRTKPAMTSTKLQSLAWCQYKGIKQQARSQVQALQLDGQSLRVDEGLSSASLLMQEWLTHPRRWLERDLLKRGTQGQYGRIGATAQRASRRTKLHSYLKKFLLNSYFIPSTTLKEGMCLWHKLTGLPTPLSWGKAQPKEHEKRSSRKIKPATETHGKNTCQYQRQSR